MIKFLFFIIYSFLIAQNQSSQKINDFRNNTFAKPSSIKQNQFKKEIRQAEVLERNGMMNEAENIYKDILTKSPGYIPAFKKLKNLYKNQNRFDELIKTVDNFIIQQPKNQFILIDQIEIYIWAGNPKWSVLAISFIKSNFDNKNILKSLISRVLSNGLIDDGIKFINYIRSQNNQPDFYAFELGNYYQIRMAFEKSLESYLILLEFNPDKYNSISSRIMSFPIEDFIVLKLKSILQQSNVKGSKLLLSDLEFRSGNFELSYKILKDNFTDPAQLLLFAQQAIDAKAFDTALIVYTDIIDDEFNSIIKNNAIYGLANALEKKSIKTDPLLPLSRFFDGNEFFESPYYSIEKTLMPSLWKAINIYDSLMISNGNLDATFRLAEIKFKAMNDLDGAFKLYKNVAEKTSNKQNRFSSALNIIDIFIAKGDTQNALKQINSFKNNFKKDNQKLILKIKESQVNFFAGNYETTKDSLIKILKDLPKNDARYNDLLDIQSIILAFNNDKENYSVFSSAQHLIRQNKRSQALELLAKHDSLEDEFIKDIFYYQSAYINILQNDYVLAIQNLELTSGNTIFSEMSLILYAEILDYLVKDISLAIDTYLKFLETYPFSIYYDDIRIRLRELAS